MPERSANDKTPPSYDNSNRARDHLANERTFLAWLRTGIAIVVFGFAIGRFAIAIRQFMEVEGRTTNTTGLTVWFGMIAIIAGVLLTLLGLVRYRQTRAQLDAGNFQPAGFVIDLVALLVALAGVTLVVYLVYIELRL